MEKINLDEILNQKQSLKSQHGQNISFLIHAGEKNDYLLDQTRNNQREPMDAAFLKDELSSFVERQELLAGKMVSTAQVISKIYEDIKNSFFAKMMPNMSGQIALIDKEIKQTKDRADKAYNTLKSFPSYQSLNTEALDEAIKTASSGLKGLEDIHMISTYLFDVSQLVKPGRQTKEFPDKLSAFQDCGIKLMASTNNLASLLEKKQPKSVVKNALSTAWTNYKEFLNAAVGFVDEIQKQQFIYMPANGVSRFKQELKVMREFMNKQKVEIEGPAK